MSLFRPRRVRDDRYLKDLAETARWEADKERVADAETCWKARALGAEADLTWAKRSEKDCQALVDELARRNNELRQEIVKLEADLIEAQQASSDRPG